MSGYLKSYVAAAMEKDPAATSKIMVLFTYPGVKALMWHRPANWCYRHKMKFLARVISQHVRFWTGIEIHPGATIGKGVFIDHGAGVVGLERKNRRYGRIGVRVGIVLAILFSLLGIRRGWKKFASFTPYFLPLWGGLGTYFVCQALDRGKKKKNPVQCVKSTGVQAPGSASQV